MESIVTAGRSVIADDEMGKRGMVFSANRPIPGLSHENTTHQGGDATCRPARPAAETIMPR